MKPYEFLEHTADIQIRSYGKELSELFVNSALGMMEFIFGKKALGKKSDRFEDISVDSDSLENLLIEWLSLLHYQSSTLYRAYIFYDVKLLEEKKIAARVGSVSARAVEDIKGVTYSELQIEKMGKIWQATVVYDI